MEKKKKKIIKKKNNFFNSLKSILIFSFIINIILLSYIYYLKTNHHAYIFTGKDDYLNINSGVINLNYDVNLLEGNNIEYINKKDIKIKEIKIGYYIIENDSIKEIITHYETFEKSTSLKETINSLTSFNVSEVAKNSKLFSNINTNTIENNLYVIMEIADENGKEIVSKISLDVSKLY